jgi:hypothetical protein
MNLQNCMCVLCVWMWMMERVDTDSFADDGDSKGLRIVGSTVYIYVVST